MPMIKHTDQPGSPAWLGRRARCFNAGDAAAMLGCDPNKTRSQLLAELHSGLQREFSDFVQERVINPGHRIEALARPIAEEILGEDLQVVGCERGTENLSRPLGASMDGLTFMEDTAWECKSANDELRAALPHTGRDSADLNDGRRLPKGKRAQMAQQQLVTGASRSLFTAADFDSQGNVTEERHCWYVAEPELQDEILAGWRQFDADLAAYVRPAAEPVKPTGHAPETLPALRIELTGAVTASNLAEFKDTALGAIRAVNRTLTTDQHFSDAEAAVKWCGEVESRIKAAKDHALSQTASIDALFRTLDDVSAEARKVRLELEKLVERRKVEIKGEMVAEAKAAYERHEATLRAECGAWRLLTPPDFGGAIKGKRSVASIRDALDTTLAQAKIKADESAHGIRTALAALEDEAKGYEHLFADRLTFIGMIPEAVRLMVRDRIAKHQEAEQKRAAALAEQERERIRAEEAAKLQREQDAAARAAAPAATPAPTYPPAPAPTVVSTGPAANVTPMRPAPKGPPSLRIGEIANRFGFGITESFLRTQLGFPAAGKQGASCLYHESDFPRICNAMIEHLQRVRDGVPAEAA